VSYCVTQAGLELIILLAQPLKSAEFIGMVATMLAYLFKFECQAVCKKVALKAQSVCLKVLFGLYIYLTC
jgi:hypothetical protein